MKLKIEKVISFEESRRVSTATGFRGYRDNSPEAIHIRREASAGRLLSFYISQWLQRHRIHCKICGLSGPTKCTEQANCLNVTLEAEMKMI